MTFLQKNFFKETCFKFITFIQNKKLIVIYPRMPLMLSYVITKRRLIGQNIRLVEDIINEMDDDKIILLLDQEKAFDRIEWDWLFKVLHVFSFRDRFIQWLKIMYKNIKVLFKQMGTYLSNFLLLEVLDRGIPYLRYCM